MDKGAMPAVDFEGLPAVRVWIVVRVQVPAQERHLSGDVDAAIHRGPEGVVVVRALQTRSGSTHRVLRLHVVEVLHHVPRPMVELLRLLRLSDDGVHVRHDPLVHLLGNRDVRRLHVHIDRLPATLHQEARESVAGGWRTEPVPEQVRAQCDDHAPLCWNAQRQALAVEGRQLQDAAAGAQRHDQHHSLPGESWKPSHGLGLCHSRRLLLQPPRLIDNASRPRGQIHVQLVRGADFRERVRHIGQPLVKHLEGVEADAAAILLQLCYLRGAFFAQEAVHDQARQLPEQSDGLHRLDLLCRILEPPAFDAQLDGAEALHCQAAREVTGVDVQLLRALGQDVIPDRGAASSEHRGVLRCRSPRSGGEARHLVPGGWRRRRPRA
mmetsp:Transcript_31307/g.79733  ORF Transcript_31307/g.79733 Transcript_31307/m.79733 type:complete len:381 (+) Transcript_31307:682-1824(+)